MYKELVVGDRLLEEYKIVANIRTSDLIGSSLSNAFKYDNQAREIYILAGENIQVIIPPSGEWEFIND